MSLCLPLEAEKSLPNLLAEAITNKKTVKLKADMRRLAAWDAVIGRVDTSIDEGKMLAKVVIWILSNTYTFPDSPFAPTRHFPVKPLWEGREAAFEEFRSGVTDHVGAGGHVLTLACRLLRNFSAYTAWFVDRLDRLAHIDFHLLDHLLVEP